MSRKLLVAVVVVKQEAGERYYAAYTRDEQLVPNSSIKVIDAGYGADVAHRWYRERYTVSGADWAYKIARKLGQK